MYISLLCCTANSLSTTLISLTFASMQTGLFFGSFNPIHIGHMILANYMISVAGMKEVWFVVSPQNPHKEKQNLLDETQRLQMVRRVVENEPKMKASAIEFDLPRPSFTVNTLAHLSEKYPERNFALILGADNLETFHKWKNYEAILENHFLYVYPRPGYTGGALAQHPHVKFVAAPQIEISSTFLRQCVKEKKEIRWFMPEAAWNYMREMHFYEK